jgi:hypothetical protein
MATSSPSQPKAARGKTTKPNGATAHAVTSPEPMKATPSAMASAAAPSAEDIARRAYEIYEREGCQPGTELQNWLRAEAELGLSKSH